MQTVKTCTKFEMTLITQDRKFKDLKFFKLWTLYVWKNIVLKLNDPHVGKSTISQDSFKPSQMHFILLSM